MNLPWRWAAVAVLVVLAAGCGSSSGPLTRSPTTTPPVTATAPAPPATAASGHGQHVAVTPAAGLRSGQQVQVQASGFSPGESLVVIECASKGAATASGDCNLASMQSVTTDAGGRANVQLTVTKGPFGANKTVCGRAQACLISVTQATQSPTQEADTPITFGLSPSRPAASRQEMVRGPLCQSPRACKTMNCLGRRARGPPPLPPGSALR